jgi:hypothetical protein
MSTMPAGAGASNGSGDIGGREDAWEPTAAPTAALDRSPNVQPIDNGKVPRRRGHSKRKCGVVVMWRRKRWAEDQKTIDALSRANDRLTADLETMVGEAERLREEVRQRDEVIAGLRKELRSPRDEG